MACVCLKGVTDTNPNLDSIQWHFPFHNYLGPGTHVHANILNGVKPIDKIDFLAMLHDIQYMQNINPTRADEIALNNAPFEFLDGIAMHIGLNLREKLNLKFNDTTNHALGDKLMYLVQNNSTYSKLFEQYGISTHNYPIFTFNQAPEYTLGQTT